MNNEDLQQLKAKASIGNVKAVNVDAPVLLALIERIESLAAPAVANAENSEREAFRDWANKSAIREDLGAWDAWQARASITSQTKPAVTLTDEQISAAVQKGYSARDGITMDIFDIENVVKEVRSILAHAAPNAQLVEALKIGMECATDLLSDAPRSHVMEISGRIDTIRAALKDAGIK